MFLLKYAYSNFRHLFELLDEAKIKWTATCGPMGEKIKALNENLRSPIIDFARVETNVPLINSMVFKDTNDLRRLLELCIGVSNGNLHPKFQNNLVLFFPSF